MDYRQLSDIFRLLTVEEPDTVRSRSRDDRTAGVIASTRFVAAETSCSMASALAKIWLETADDQS